MEIMDKIVEKISNEAIILMQKAISDASGNEVFFRGIPNNNGMVVKVQVLARGNKHSVPAILKIMRKGEVIIHNHPSGYLYPSDADTEIASIYSNQMAGASYIINNSVTDLYVITELIDDKNVKIDIGPYFEEHGILVSTFDDFEYRKEQFQMAKHIEDGLNNETKIIVEAGTGTGKTLAYLVPIIEWAKKNRKRAVISTNTINLQEQLLNKDIPIAKKIIHEDFKYLLVKGRGNYLCNRKFTKITAGDNIDVSDYSNDQHVQIKEILKWGLKTKNGDKAELPFEVDGTVWELFASESDICAGNKCPHREDCFFMLSRNEKKQADILITNHHMFFSDLAIRKETGFNTEFSIIPDYGLVVFDEAHNVEKVARDYFSIEVSKYSFTKIMNYIYAFEGKRKNTGSIEILAKYVKFTSLDNKDLILKNIEDTKKSHKKLFSCGREYFNFIIDKFSKGQEGTYNFRIKKDEIANNKFLSNLSLFEKEVSTQYFSYNKKVYEIIKSLEDDSDLDGTINEFAKYFKRLETFFLNFKFVNSFNNDDFIYWIEVNSKKSNSKLVATPLRIENDLKMHLYLNLKQIIFTSATIAIGKNFNYFKSSLGLLDENTIDKAIKSPFNYDKQMKVYLPTDILDPNDTKFSEDTAEYLKNLLLKSMGKTFVLFTSYRVLNYVYYMIRDSLESSGLDLFIHGMAPRTQLLNMFMQSKQPVLFGTDSFWEGVDIKGEQLSSVIIVKLPFKVPNDPVTEAIIEYIISQGKNSFTDYQVPEAVIKFKQGIGRLIRSKNDKGTITILDNRIINKRYGKYFLDSIPTKNILIGSKLDILNDIDI
jgi:ATP-dependent DNA helicase DinG